MIIFSTHMVWGVAAIQPGSQVGDVFGRRFLKGGGPGTHIILEKGHV
jgi:hypothetical protein